MIDGIVLSNVLADLQILANGRVDKVYQPNKEEIVLTIRAAGQNHKLLLSANASNARVNFTTQKLENPAQPPMFCMLLRKHITGRIVGVYQPEFERIIEIHIESHNEMMELSTKRLIIEIMGKHSNIVLVRDDGVIIDAIKHVNSLVNSVRELLPGRPYTPPPGQDKISFLNLSPDNWAQVVSKHLQVGEGDSEPQAVSKTIYQSYTGISPTIANIICNQVGVDSDRIQISADESQSIYNGLQDIITAISTRDFKPFVAKSDKKYVALHTLFDWVYDGYQKLHFDTISQAIEYWFTNREQDYRITQKTADLKKIVQQNIARCVKKQDMFHKDLRAMQGKDQLKLLGELITANAHAIPAGASSFTTQNYYDENLADITIDLDPDKNPIENAQHLFKAYNKQKRAEIAIHDQLADNTTEETYLQSVLNALSKDLTDTEIDEIREELADARIIKNRGTNKHKKTTSKPLVFTSSDGFEIVVGKNNKQNDDITTKALNTDIWLHTKDIPGSHVVIRAGGAEVPDRSIEEAASLAAYHSKASGGSNVPVDYTRIKYVKKTSGAKPGMVIYTHQKTAFVKPLDHIPTGEHTHG